MEFIFYLGDVFTPVNFALLLVGTIGGLVLGATPGLSPTTARVPGRSEAIVGMPTARYSKTLVGRDSR